MSPRRLPRLIRLPRRVADLEREVTQLGAALERLDDRRRELYVVRCACARCGAHLLGVAGRVTLGGQCANCGGQELLPVLTEDQR